MEDTSPSPECEPTSPSASPTTAPNMPSPGTSASAFVTSISASTDASPFLPDLPPHLDFLESESQQPSDIEPYVPPLLPENLAEPEKHRLSLRHRERWVLSDPEGWRAMRRKFRAGKLSPQEFRELKDGFYVEMEQKPVTPPVAIQIVNNLADGRTLASDYIVTTEEKHK